MLIKEIASKDSSQISAIIDYITATRVYVEFGDDKYQAGYVSSLRNHYLGIVGDSKEILMQKLAEAQNPSFKVLPPFPLNVPSNPTNVNPSLDTEAQGKTGQLARSAGFWKDPTVGKEPDKQQNTPSQDSGCCVIA